MRHSNQVSFSANNRAALLKQMEQGPLDLLIIGGGITGAGIALDAAARGLKVALVEMQDYAAGTSSRSTKLVHGGLRYLKQLEIGVVAEVGKERAVVYENGPHVTTPEWMLLPFYKGGTFGSFSTSIGLRVYDFLAGVKKQERRKMLSTAETQKMEPLLKKEGMKGGGYYVEYRTDDARLTIEVMKKAAEYGAIAVNYAKVDSLRYDNGGKVIGAVVQDQMDGQSYEIHATKIVNATGPWVDKVRELDKSKQGKTLRLTKGVHLVFSQQKFPLRQAIYFDTADKRMVFAIPRDGKTYLGTTDTNYSGNIAHPVMTEEDRTYLLACVNDMFPSLKLKAADVESSWAGLRPLIQQEGKDPSEISRRDEIFVSPSGLVSIAGGKLTGYRKMAETVVDKVISIMNSEGLGASCSPCVTKNIPLSGGDIGGSKQLPAFIQKYRVLGQKYGFTAEESEFLAGRYGSNVSVMLEKAAEAAAWGQRFHLSPLVSLQLYYAIHNEMTVKPVDFFIRRTGDLFFNINQVRQYAATVIEAMSDHFEWSGEQKDLFTDELNEAIHDAVNPVK